MSNMYELEIIFELGDFAVNSLICPGIMINFTFLEALNSMYRVAQKERNTIYDQEFMFFQNTCNSHKIKQTT